MRSVLLLVLVLALLAGCSTSQATPAAPVEEAPAGQTPAEQSVTQEVPAQTGEAPTSGENNAAPAGAVTYVIVPEESSASYEVGEVFFNQNNRHNIAVGSTQAIQGSVTLDAANPQSAQVSAITVDISALQSDEAMRDNRIRRQWLQSSTYPLATFTPTAITGLPAAYTEGEQVNFQVTGDLTIRDDTQSVTFDVTARLENGELRGSASTLILMTDFGFDPPSIAGILQAENEVNVRFDFVARPS